MEEISVKVPRDLVRILKVKDEVRTDSNSPAAHDDFPTVTVNVTEIFHLF
ncbi:hypothetical protein [Ferroglobus sp.]|nr:hypothetical protein [Ferroglobus sp.]